MKRLGPELKMPDMKAPPFVADIYHDLRERRLLPLIALVVVAIVAVPFLLGGSEKPAPPLPAIGMAAGGESQAIDTSSLKVVQAKPGLRDYKKRLAHRKPRNPFKQQFTGSVTKNAQLNEPTTTTTTTTTSTSETTSGSPTGSTTPPTSSPGGAPTSSPSGRHGELTLLTYVINVKITKQGAKSGERRSRPLSTTSCPRPRCPARRRRS